jgi:hypothetical protein
MSDDDKAIYKMIASYLERAIDAIQELSPDGAHALAIAIADNELPHTGDLETLVINVKKLSK